jgi:hypothetical protein
LNSKKTYKATASMESIFMDRSAKPGEEDLKDKLGMTYTI